MAKLSNTPKDGDFEQYVEKLVQQSANSTQQKTLSSKQELFNPSSTVLPPQNLPSQFGKNQLKNRQGSQQNILSKQSNQYQQNTQNKQNDQTEQELYVFEWKKQILNLVYIWIALGALCYFVLPPHELNRGLLMVFILGIICFVGNYTRKGKPLPTRKEKAKKLGTTFLKKIIMMFVKN